MSSNIVLGLKAKRYDDDGIENNWRSRALGIVHLFLLPCGKTSSGLEMDAAQFEE